MYKLSAARRLKMTRADSTYRGDQMDEGVEPPHDGEGPRSSHPQFAQQNEGVGLDVNIPSPADELFMEIEAAQRFHARLKERVESAWPKHLRDKIRNNPKLMQIEMELRKDPEVEAAISPPMFNLSQPPAGAM